MYEKEVKFINLWNSLETDDEKEDFVLKNDLRASSKECQKILLCAALMNDANFIKNGPFATYGYSLNYIRLVLMYASGGSGDDKIIEKIRSFVKLNIGDGDVDEDDRFINEEAIESGHFHFIEKTGLTFSSLRSLITCNSVESNKIIENIPRAKLEEIFRIGVNAYQMAARERNQWAYDYFKKIELFTLPSRLESIEYDCLMCNSKSIESIYKSINGPDDVDEEIGTSAMILLMVDFDDAKICEDRIKIFKHILSKSTIDYYSKSIQLNIQPQIDHKHRCDAIYFVLKLLVDKSYGIQLNDKLEERIDFSKSLFKRLIRNMDELLFLLKNNFLAMCPEIEKRLISECRWFAKNLTEHRISLHLRGYKVESSKELDNDIRNLKIQLKPTVAHIFPLVDEIVQFL